MWQYPLVPLVISLNGGFNMKAWEIVEDGGPTGLSLRSRVEPQPGHGEVLVEVSASSLNYRDLLTVEDPVSRNISLPMSPNSDCAGKVIGIGSGVTDIKVGDRVMGCFFQDWIDGAITPEAMETALGGAIPGVLAEQVVLNANGVVPVPDYLSDVEAATLPCAALTAWHALTREQPVTAGETILLLGTGGVSVFAQQFCSAMGATTIVTSSEDEKLVRISALGAGQTINYNSVPNWAQAVLDMTGGRGVDRVIEVGGPGTLQKSISCTRVGGAVQLIGILTGDSGKVVPTDIMRKSLKVHGIYVGSKAMFLEMNTFLTNQKLHPVVDEVFDFGQAQNAFHCMRGAKHFGKLVIRVRSTS